MTDSKTVQNQAPVSRSTQPRPERGTDRYQTILQAAADLFAENGYKATSIRDIGNRVGLLGGSLYHHIKSKEALFLQIHSTATQEAIDRITGAVAPLSDPWERLEAACREQLAIQLSPDSPSRVLTNDFSAVPDEVRVELVKQRDSFEQLFADLVADLPLDPAIDRRLFRIFVLSILNSVPRWYKSGKLKPAEIAQQVIMMLRKDPTPR